MSIVKIQNLTVKISGNIILRNLTLSIDSGEICCILGKNGAGKSTFLKSILGIGEVEGEISLLNQAINLKTRRNLLEKIGVLIDRPLSYNHLTVWKNLEIVAMLHDIKEEEILVNTLKITGLYEEKQKKVSQLSSGMKQRLGLAIAYVHSPQVLILDEPTTALDPQSVVEFRNLIKQINKQFNTTIIYSTHHLEEAMKMSSRILIIKEGVIAFDSKIEKIEELSVIRIPREHCTDIRIEEFDYFEEDNTISFLLNSHSHKLKSFLIFKPYLRPATLEDIYLAKHKSIV